MNVEPLYDEYIAPLMDQIIDICKREGIPMVASFQLTDGDSPLYCSTVIPTQWTAAWLAQIQSAVCAKAGP